MPTLKAGALAYFDCAAGLVPCKVLSIRGRENSAQEVTVQVTASHDPYKRGEILRSAAHWVVPRDAVRRRKYGVTILPYLVECSVQ